MLKQNLFTFVLGLAMISIGLLFGLPHLLIPKLIDSSEYFSLGGGTSPSSAITTEEVYAYVAEVQEILEKKWVVRDTQLFEYKQSPSPFLGETLPTYIMAGLVIITGSTAKAFVIADFLFPPLILLIIYYLGRKLKLSRSLALLTGLTILIAGDLISLIPYPKPIWGMLVNLERKNDFLFFSRNFHPQLSFPLLILALSFLIKGLESKKKKWQLLAGLAIGTQFYVYLFNWTALIGTTGILGIWMWLKKKKQLLIKLFWIILITLLVAMPYLINMYEFRNTIYANDFFLKSSYDSRLFLILTARYALLALILLIATRKRSLPERVILAIVGSTVILPDIASLFLGRDLEGKHWMRRILMPISILVAAKVVEELKLTKKRWFKLVMALFLLVLVQFGIRVQVLASHRYVNYYYLPPAKKEFFNWIKTNTNQDQVIASLDTALMAELPALTQANNAVPITIRSLATTDESLDRFLRVSAFYGLSKESVEKLLINNFISRVFYFQAFNRNKPSFELSPDVLAKILLQYQNVLEEESISTFPYRLDYIVVGPKEKRIMQVNFDDKFWLQKQYGNQEYKIYRVIDE